MKKMLEELKKQTKLQYKGVFEIMRLYWENYGGFFALFSSVYVHISLIISLLSFGLWSKPDWWATPISVLPGLVSFTLAGYAMLTALGNDEFRERLAVSSADKPPSAFMQISTTFAHFIVVQSIALIFALICSAKIRTNINIFGNYIFGKADLLNYFILSSMKYFLWFFSYFLFVYACILVFSCTFSLFRTTKWLNHFLFSQARIKRAKEEKNIVSQDNTTDPA